MTTAELDRMCEAANKSVRDYVARCAGQHVRRMHAFWARRRNQA